MSSVDFIQQHQPTMYTARALWYLHNFFNQQKWPTGFAYETEIRACNLDFSIASLQRIDSLIDKIRGNHTPNEASFLSHDRNQNFLFFLAFYCGELVGRARQQAPIWYSYPDFLDTFPQMQGKIPQTFSNYLIVRSLKNEIYPKDTVWFPLTAIYERLFNPEKNKSVYATIRTLIGGNVDENHVFPELAPISLPLNMSTEIAKFPKQGLAYVQMVPPSWLKQDDLYRQFDSLANLFSKGRVTLGAIVPTQADIQTQSVEHLVVDVVYDPKGRTDIDTLQEVAKNLAQLGNAPITDPQDKIYSEHLKASHTRLFGFDVSRGISSTPLKVSSMFVWRPHLPDGRFAIGYCPILVDDFLGTVTVLPAYFWRDTDLYKRWRKVSGSTSESLSLAFYQYSSHVPDLWQREFSSIVRPRLDEIPSIGQYMTEEMVLVPKSERDDQYIQRFYQYVVSSSEAERNEEEAILTCAQQLLEHGDVSGFSVPVLKKARMRIHDFSSILKELVDPQLNQKLGKQPLLQVDKAIHYKKLTAEQINQLLAVLQKGVQQGNSNAMMYLAYLNLVGLFVPQSVEQADNYILAAINTGDWRALSFKAERLIADHEDPQRVIDVLEQGIARGHPTLHTRLAKFALDLSKQQMQMASTPVAHATMTEPTQPVMQTQTHAQPQATTAQDPVIRLPQYDDPQAEQQTHSAPAPLLAEGENLDEEKRMQLYEMLRSDKDKWNDAVKVKTKIDFSDNKVRLFAIIIGILLVGLVIFL